MPSQDHPSPSERTPVVLTRSDHCLSRSLISPEALKVLYRLHRSGHIAYLVGGGVRDLLLGRTPKDFDISTSAHPNQVRSLFSNCRLIGRRFRLAHVFFHGGKIIEVSTFRTISEFGDGDGPITSDNTFGTPAEDAFRRDFTINALFYNIADFSVLDYVGGLDDLRRGLVRCIGDPWVRFREDPIRILRGVRFAGLLGFELEPETEAASRALREDIWKGAMPRILDEVLRGMVRGTARSTFELMLRYGLAETLFPEIGPAEAAETLDVLGRVDHLFAQGREVSPDLVLSCLASPSFARAAASAPGADLVHLAKEETEPMARRLQIPRRIQDSMRHRLAAQPRLAALRDPRHRPRTLLRKAYFPEAFELFCLTAAGTAEGRELIEEWRHLAGPRAEASPARPRTGARAGRGQRGAPAEGEGGAGRGRRRRRRPRRRRDGTP